MVDVSLEVELKSLTVPQVCFMMFILESWLDGCRFGALSHESYSQYLSVLFFPSSFILLLLLFFCGGWGLVKKMFFMVLQDHTYSAPF